MPVTVSKEDGAKTLVAKGLVDTGSTYCAVPMKMVEELGLVSLGRRMMNTPLGGAWTSIYFVRLRLPNSSKVYLLGAAGCSPQQGYDMLLGRNVIRLGLLKVTEDWFSFQISPEAP